MVLANSAIFRPLSEGERVVACIEPREIFQASTQIIF